MRSEALVKLHPIDVGLGDMLASNHPADRLGQVDGLVAVAPLWNDGEDAPLSLEVSQALDLEDHDRADAQRMRPGQRRSPRGYGDHIAIDVHATHHGAPDLAILLIGARPTLQCISLGLRSHSDVKTQHSPPKSPLQSSLPRRRRRRG
eukprot:scaffold1954_cov268-Pinguiococcus_pyrenoidosus.AAC.285